MKVYKPEWRCTLCVTEGAETSARWTTRLAWRIRRLADRLDGHGRTIKLDCQTEPRLSREDIDACLGKGFIMAQGLLTELTHQAACEDIMRDAQAELFEQASLGPRA